MFPSTSARSRLPRRAAAAAGAATAISWNFVLDRDPTTAPRGGRAAAEPLRGAPCPSPPKKSMVPTTAPGPKKNERGVDAAARSPAGSESILLLDEPPAPPSPPPAPAVAR